MNLKLSVTQCIFSVNLFFRSFFILCMQRLTLTTVDDETCCSLWLWLVYISSDLIDEQQNNNKSNFQVHLYYFSMTWNCMLQITSIFQANDFVFILSVTFLFTLVQNLHATRYNGRMRRSTRTTFPSAVIDHSTFLCERWSLTVCVSVFYFTMHCQLEMFSIVQSLRLPWRNFFFSPILPSKWRSFFFLLVDVHVNVTT